MDDLLLLSANLYLEVFSEDEIRELTVFYKTELGQKLVAKMPQLMQAILREIGGVTKDMQADLLAKLQDRFAELDIEDPA